MRMFLSYASEDRDIAEQIYLILLKANHQVFFDRAELPPGGDYNTKIQKAINKCELFVFLISPDSVAKTSYALTELKFAREKWPHPEGHVLPVMVRATTYDVIPPYLKAVSILEPEGNTAAEVGRQVAGWRRRSKLTPRVVVVALAVLISLAAGIWAYNHYLRSQPENKVQPQPSLAILSPGLVRFKGNINRERVIDPLREFLKTQGISTPVADRDAALTETSIEYYDPSHREAAEQLAKLVGRYLKERDYAFEPKVNYSATRPSLNREAKVVISIHLQ